jgi:PAS domain S-box-containing protein
MQYSFTPLMLPALISIGFLVVVDVYSWRHRRVSGAQWFAIACLMGIFWSTGAAFALAADDPATKIFWVKFGGIWPLAIVTAMLCFMLEYANLGHWLTRRTLIFLSIPPFLVFLLIATNNFHQTFFRGYSFEQGVFPEVGVLGWISIAYAYLLGLLGLLVFIWLFIYSPQKRWPVALCLLGQVLVRGAFLLDNANIFIFGAMEASILAFAATSGLYALALFGFRMFDPVLVARERVIEQIRDGMLVLDTQSAIVDLNPAAEKILGKDASRLKGQPIQEAFPAQALIHTCLDPGSQPAGAELTPTERVYSSEIHLGSESDLKTYDLQLSPLKDAHGQARGCLILMHDVTEQRQAQAQLLEQQRALATVQERERLARELHDNVGQVLGYVSMQAQAIRKWVHDGETALAETQLTRLANTAQEAHTDLRESILSLRMYSAGQWSFLQSLRQHLEAYQNNYGVQTELFVPAGLAEDAFEAGTGVQLLRVIQEALTNARKHGHARCVLVSFELKDDQVGIRVTDDGVGFDPGEASGHAGEHFGLAFMAERIAQIGGTMSLTSQPGAGTQVILNAPIKRK